MNMLQCGKKFRLLIIFKERDEEVKVVFMVNRINTITILIIVFLLWFGKNDLWN